MRAILPTLSFANYLCCTPTNLATLLFPTRAMGQVWPRRFPAWVWRVGPWQMPSRWNCGSRSLGCEKAVQSDQGQPQGEAQSGRAGGCRVLPSPGPRSQSLQFCPQTYKLSDTLPSQLGCIDSLFGLKGPLTAPSQGTPFLHIPYGA